MQLKTWKLTFTILTIALTTGAQAAVEPGGTADEEVARLVESRTAEGLSWETDFVWEKARLTVVRGEGEADAIDFEAGSSLRWVPDPELPDGRYSYHLRVIPAVDPLLAEALVAARAAGDEPAAERLERAILAGMATRSGQVTVRNGAILVPAVEVVSEEPRREHSELDTTALGTSGPVAASPSTSYLAAANACVGGSCDDSNLNREHYALQLQQSRIGLEFVDVSTDSGVATLDWQIDINDLSGDGGEYFKIFDCGPGTCAARPAAAFVLEGGTPADTLHIGPGGGIGIGTVPSEDIHVLDSAPGLRLEDTEDSTFFQIRYNQRTLVMEGNTEQNIATVDARAPAKSLVVDDSGRVGLGLDPVADLHVRDTLAEEPNASFLLDYQGLSGLLVETDFLGAKFFHMDVGTPFPALTIELGGVVTVEEFLVVGGGTQILGDLEVYSSREAKRILAAAAPQSVLARVEELPLYNWHFREDDEETPHLGPMAEDFAAAFGLGEDPRLVSPNDLSGVALAAIQGLAQRLQQKEERIETLESQKAGLAGQVDEMEVRLERLEDRLGELEAERTRLVGLPSRDP